MTKNMDKMKIINVAMDFPVIMVVRVKLAQHHHLAMLPNAPAPSHRHGAPSGPWPFLDIDDAVDKERIANPESHLLLAAKACPHLKLPATDFCWCKYPQSLFPNWAQAQQRKSRVQEVVETTTPTTIHYLDIKADGFVDAGDKEVTEPTLDSAWAAVSQGRPPGVHVRSVFIEKLSGPAMQMLGTHYGIEPFFFSSSLGWIPSRFQSNIVPRESDRMCCSFVASCMLTHYRHDHNAVVHPCD